MATEYSILARLTANTAQFVRDMTGAFRTTARQGEKAAESIGRRFAKATGKAAGKVAERGAQSLVGVLGLGIKEAVDFEKVIDDIGIQSGATASEMDSFRASVTGVSEATGISRTKVAQAGESLVNLLGPAGRNADLLAVLARTAVASGADIGDLAGLVSAVADSFQIAVDDTEAMEQALSAFLSTGKQGKVPLAEMNSVLQEVSANFKEMGAKGPRAAADISAALQIARRSFGSAAQAGTGMRAGVTALKQHGDKITKEFDRLARKDKSLRHLKGFSVWQKGLEGKQLKDFRELAPALAKLNLQQLQDTMGSAEAVKFWAAFKDADLEALTAELGDAEKALEIFKNTGFQAFLGMADVAVVATDSVDDFGKRQETESFRLQKAWNKARLALAKAITPELVEKFVAGVESLSEVFQFLAKNVTMVVSALVSLKALQMATDFSKTATAAAKAADAVGGIGASAAGAAGQVGNLQKAMGALSALTGGFAVGQAIGGAIVRSREKRFARQKKEQKKNLADMEKSANATQQLIEADLVSEEGRLDPAFQRELAKAKLTGQELTPLQQAAETALAGFEVARPASGSFAEEQRRRIEDRERGGPEREALITGAPLAMIAAFQDLTLELRAQRAATVENTQAQREKPNGRGNVGNLGKR